MILETEIDYKFESPSAVGRHNKKYNTTYKCNDIIKLYLKDLLTKRDYRCRLIKCKCDDCGKEFYSQLRTVCNKKVHYCKYCILKGHRNRMFRKTLPKEIKKKISDVLCKNPPMLGKHHSKKVCDEQAKRMIGTKRHLGYKNTQEQLKRMSDAVNIGYANGTRAKTHGNALKGYYKGIIYGSSYEKYFLQYVDTFSLLDFIKRGPVIEYINSENKIAHYLPDYYIEELKLVIEIKSDHFWHIREDNNILKMKQTQKDYNYLLILNNDLFVFSYWLNKLKVNNKHDIK